MTKTPENKHLYPRKYRIGTTGPVLKSNYHANIVPDCSSFDKKTTLSQMRYLSEKCLQRRGYPIYRTFSRSGHEPSWN